jgi:hypothetical protein
MNQSIVLDESKNSAIEFYKSVKESFSYITKLRETSLEPSLPLTFGNICKELG